METDLKFETVNGLPEKLPPGERILWQGKPTVMLLAWHSFGLKLATLYVVVAMIYQLVLAFSATMQASLVPILVFYLLIWFLASSLLYLLAHFQRASTIYTVTNKRIVLKIGAALPISYNIPFKQISSVDLKSYGVKGSIAISLLGDNKISYLSCWPHVRPWHFSKPCPSLLFLDNIEEVSQIIKKAMEDELIFSELKNNDPNTPFQQLDSNSYKRVSIA